tara:strand:+ start:50 stop:640 length:591 start_codon:yes stop_codon:yes gene_type:complete
MKKSELRKLIRESIKGLMNEQLNPNVRCIRLSRCTPGAPSGFNRGNYSVNGQVPQLGQIIQKQNMQGANGRFAIYQVNPFDPAGCGHNQGYDIQESTSTDPCEACDHISGGCPSLTTTSAGSCNPNAWSNHANWTSTFTNTVTNLNPNNPNQPCNFLNNKIAQFTANLQGTGGGNYQNMQNCKLDLCNQLHASNNC